MRASIALQINREVKQKYSKYVYLEALKLDENIGPKAGSQTVAPALATPASLENLPEMQLRRPHPRLAELESLGVGFQSLWFNKPSPWLRCTFQFENH